MTDNFGECMLLKNLQSVVLIIFYYQQKIADDNYVIWYRDIHLKVNLLCGAYFAIAFRRKTN